MNLEEKAMREWALKQGQKEEERKRAKVSMARVAVSTVANILKEKATPMPERGTARVGNLEFRVQGAGDLLVHCDEWEVYGWERITDLASLGRALENPPTWLTRWEMENDMPHTEVHLSAEERIADALERIANTFDDIGAMLEAGL